MTTNQEAILEKIRKLNAHANSAAEIGNEAEAQAFAQKVQELLTAYKLSQTDLNSPNAKADEPIGETHVGWEELNLKVRKVRIPWAESLAKLVANAYYCRFVVTDWKMDTVAGRLVYGQIGIFVGAETDRKVATCMFVTLGRFLNQLAERETHLNWKKMVAGGTKLPPEAHGFKAGFMAGFIARLAERFDEEIRPKVQTSTSAAIVLVRKNSLDKVQNWMRSNMNVHSTRPTHLDTGSGAGRARGREAASEFNLSGKAMEGRTSGGKLLR